jgi:uncharacterized protein (DUF433 family)/methylase of polypeptide subunit release factors
MPEKQDSGEEAYIEFYHQEALSSGSRIREKLSEAVEQSLKLLANGLLRHPDNDKLRQQVFSGQLTPVEYYLYLLRLVYRVLFLMVIEERHLIYPEKREEEITKKRNIYYSYYSIRRLTLLAEKQIYVDPRKTDLWKSLLVTFSLFEDGNWGEKLGIKPLGSGLFDSGALGMLISQNLDNGNLLKVLILLVSFENENKQRIRVNYADLDVEEFGSVYEGLLEYDAAITKVNGQPLFSFVEGEGRSSSGSHYTPEELVKPLIKNSLDYIIEERLKVAPDVIDLGTKQSAQENQLLSITVCDVACGSGHILLSAARRIALELARVRTGEDQPAPSQLRLATRDVIKNCIYGVDLNPLAVELCKVALWLEAHNPGEPLNFLDHHIKCGNSIVGLAHREELQKGIVDEAFKKLPVDDKEIVKYFRDKNKAERKSLLGQFKIDPNSDVNNRVEELTVSYGDVAKLPEQTPAEVEAKAKAYEKLMTGFGRLRLKQLADMQTAQFFISKTEEHEIHLLTDGDYRSWLNGKQQITGQAPAFATSVGANKRFFHWFLEFPTVMQNGGFDCILGNPPFLGGMKISTRYNPSFLNYLHSNYIGAKGTADLVSYFFRRIYDVINKNRFLSLISTKSISEGGTRLAALETIRIKKGTIINAIRSMKWPGQASVDVALVTIFKGEWYKKKILNGKEVTNISTYLDDALVSIPPRTLSLNSNISSIGSFVLGDGFLLEKEQADKLIRSNPANEIVIKPYINGDDLNNDVQQRPSRWVINFGTRPLSYIEQNFKDCLDIVKEKVKPVRDGLKGNPTADDRRKRWWQFARPTQDLYDRINKSDRVLVVAQTTKQPAFVFLNTDIVFSLMTVVFNYSEISFFSVLQCSIHEIWAWKNGSTNSISLRYTPSSIFETFPMPNIDYEKFEQIGSEYYDVREHLMESMKIGLTKTYNTFHTQEIQAIVKSTILKGKTNKEIERQYGKEVWNLWNHLQRTEGACSWEEAVQGIIELRQLHKQMDEAVLEAYGWHENSEKWGKAIHLRHDFYEVDYLPENDRVRYTIHPVARKEVLKRLLLLNHERYEEEILQGLHKKKDVKAFYAQNGRPVPQNVIYSDAKPKKKAKKENIPTQTAQKGLFDDVNNTIMKEFNLHEGIYSIRDTAEIINQPYNKVRRWFLKLSEANYEGLSDSTKIDIDNRRISFHGLVELVIIGELLEAGVKSRKIFKAREDLSSIINKPYPFATSDVKDKLKVSGSDIVFNFDEGLVTLDGSRQFNFEFIREFFADIEFKSGIAIRLLPAKGLRRIQINPKAAGGMPAFVSQKDVKVETILRFYRGLDSVEEIIEDYGISEEDIKAALAYQS